MKIFSIVLILIFMADPVWGLLSKSAVDPETVEGAVNRLVAVHEADETSHLGTGESLQSHKASEIIDHVANSIIEDKIATGAISSRAITTDQLIGKDIRTAANVGSGVDGVKMTSAGIEMWQNAERKVNIPVSGDPEFKGAVVASQFRLGVDSYWTDFKTVDDWGVYGTGYNYGGFKDRSIVASGAFDTYKTFLLESGNTEFWDADLYEFYFEIQMSATFPTSHEGWVGLQVDHNGFLDTGNPDRGIAFKFLSGKIYSVWPDEDGAKQITEISATIPTGYHRYSVHYKKGTYIRWYIDDVLEHEETGTFPDMYLEEAFGISVDKHSGSGLSGFYLTNLVLQRIPL